MLPNFTAQVLEPTADYIEYPAVVQQTLRQRYVCLHGCKLAWVLVRIDSCGGGWLCVSSRWERRDTMEMTTREMEGDLRARHVERKREATSDQKTSLGAILG